MHLQLKTVLNHVHPIKGFVYKDVRLLGDGAFVHIDATDRRSRQQQGTVLQVHAGAAELRPPADASLRDCPAVGHRGVAAVQPAP
jgi:hypothetical protein